MVKNMEPVRGLEPKGGRQRAVFSANDPCFTEKQEATVSPPYICYIFHFIVETSVEIVKMRVSWEKGRASGVHSLREFT